MYRRSFPGQHPIVLGLGILFGLGVVVTYWPVFLALGMRAGCLALVGAGTRLRLPLIDSCIAVHELNASIAQAGSQRSSCS